LLPEKTNKSNPAKYIEKIPQALASLQSLIPAVIGKYKSFIFKYFYGFRLSTLLWPE
jgi:hypothetical protein